MEKILGEEAYRATETGEWMRAIGKACLDELAKLSDQYKYMSMYYLVYVILGCDLVQYPLHLRLICFFAVLTLPLLLIMISQLML